ncbi:hypothetical protein [Brevibacillus daliensis]|uniref:hypothetical protein n=1 Tax=Brevibacillus daliensis TaxID=2892995 RepID=UPI001E33FF19|nr:hypothetical protein [Brevibacillus daliensis]
MTNKSPSEEVQIVDFEEMLTFVEKRLAQQGMKVGRQEIAAIIQAEEEFLMEKGIIEEVQVD